MKFGPLFIALGVAFTGVVAEAQSYARSRGRNAAGQQIFCISWSKRNLVYRIDGAGSARTPGDSEFAALEASFATWQRVSDDCSDFKITAGPLIAKPPVGKGSDTDNVLTFREQPCKTVVPAGDPCEADMSCRERYGCWEGPLGTIALTTASYSTRTGIISGADIEFNASQYFFTTVSGQPCPEDKPAATCVAYDLQNVATHEIGHFFGFDHVNSATSTMAPTAILGDLQKRLLDLGTKEGLCEVYPAGGPPTICLDPSKLGTRIRAAPASMGLGCSHQGRSLLAGLAVLALLRWRRRQSFYT